MLVRNNNHDWISLALDCVVSNMFRAICRIGITAIPQMFLSLDKIFITVLIVTSPNIELWFLVFPKLVQILSDLLGILWVLTWRGHLTLLSFGIRLFSARLGLTSDSLWFFNLLSRFSRFLNLLRSLSRFFNLPRRFSRFVQPAQKVQQVCQPSQKAWQQQQQSQKARAQQISCLYPGHAPFRDHPHSSKFV